jgi:salicylate hydroxylase
MMARSAGGHDLLRRLSLPSGQAPNDRGPGLFLQVPAGPQVLFADRTPVSADLVVGADGTHSVVARHLAGGPTNGPTGIIAFSGRILLRDLRPGEQQRKQQVDVLETGVHAWPLHVARCR